MFGDCGLSALSFDSIPSSTFWLVVVFLFIGISIVFDLVDKNKKDLETHSKNTDDSFRYQRQDLNSAFSRILALEKKITDCCKVPPKKVENVKNKSRVRNG